MTTRLDLQLLLGQFVLLIPLVEHELSAMGTNGEQYLNIVAVFLLTYAPERLVWQSSEAMGPDFVFSYLSLEKRRLWGDLTEAFHYLNHATGELGRDFFIRECSDRARRIALD